MTLALALEVIWSYDPGWGVSGGRGDTCQGARALPRLSTMRGGEFAGRNQCGHGGACGPKRASWDPFRADETRPGIGTGAQEQKSLASRASKEMHVFSFGIREAEAGGALVAGPSVPPGSECPTQRRWAGVRFP